MKYYDLSEIHEGGVLNKAELLKILVLLITRYNADGKKAATPVSLYVFIDGGRSTTERTS